ncbi:MAG: hypothetical protein AAF378_13685 [Cyanobacteria bacterium P01_A01_bin.84]
MSKWRWGVDLRTPKRILDGFWIYTDFYGEKAGCKIVVKIKNLFDRKLFYSHYKN